LIEYLVVKKILKICKKTITIHLMSLNVQGKNLMEVLMNINVKDIIADSHLAF